MVAKFSNGMKMKKRAKQAAKEAVKEATPVKKTSLKSSGVSNKLELSAEQKGIIYYIRLYLLRKENTWFTAGCFSIFKCLTLGLMQYKYE
jgi:hypothetical protein